MNPRVEVEIECWEQANSRLGKHSPFICVKGGRGACDYLLTVLDKLAAAGVGAQRKIILKPFQRRKKCSSISLTISIASEELQEMSFTRILDVANFEFTPVGIEKFREAVVTWRNGGEDFSISPRRRGWRDGGSKDRESGEVWFWSDWEP